MGKILVIAPYQGLKELFTEVNDEMNKQLEIRYGDLYEGLQIAKSIEDKGYDVIISRGATAQLLREHCGLPIVDVNFSAYDILRALRLMKDFPGEKGIMSYFNVVRGADEIGKLIDLNLKYYPIYGSNDMEQQMTKAIEDGIETVIGDVVTTNYAKQHGLRTVLITSGKESVIDAIHAAEQIAFYTEREKKKIVRLEKSLHHAHEGIVIFNQNGQVELVNETLLQQLGLVDKEFNQELITNNFPFLNIEAMLYQGKEENLSIKLNECRYDIVKKPLYQEKVVIGAMAVVKPEKLVEMGAQIDYRMTPGVTFHQLVGSTTAFQNIIISAKKMSQSLLPIMIDGEPGTGRSSFAKAIHNQGALREGPFISFNCSLYSENEAEELLFGIRSQELRTGVIEQANGGTLYLKDIESLPLVLQDELVTTIQKRALTRLNDTHPVNIEIRLIASSQYRLKELHQNKRLTNALYHMLNTFTLHLLPLRERKEDIHHIAMHFIANYNQRTDKQLVGLNKSLLKRLERHMWPGNLSELKYIIYKMCDKTKGPFIDLSEVEEIIDKLHQSTSSQLNGVVLNITGKSLKDIEKAVITKLLEKEDYNQSKVAKQLAINRTTLWRKLNEEK